MKSLTEFEFDYIMENANWIQLYQYFKEEYDMMKDEIKEIVLNVKLSDFIEKNNNDC